MTHPKLYIPGPTEVHPDVLAAQAQPMVGHRSQDFAELFYRILPRLKQVLLTEQHVYITASSGTGLQEAAVRNAVRPGRKVLNMVAGAFADRWHQVSVSNGKDAVRVDIEWGQPIRPEDVDAALAAGGFDAVTIVHNETSTGVMSDIEAIARLVREKYPDVLILVDAVSSASGVRIAFDEWGLDMLLTSSQKAFALPPGLALAAVSDRMLERAKQVPHRGWYFDLLTLEKYLAAGKTTPATPAISLLYALDLQLDRILAEGLENRWARHAACMEMTHAWARKHGFELFPAAGYESRTVTCVRNTREIDVPAMIAFARAQNMVIGNGYGALKNQTFRIAHMGELGPDDMRALFAVLDAFLANQ
ncbi:MAG TPA: alanine--glyoxylate aminotransferase family protein [Anaerolineae bacterium]|nr:alanine--glyoxylate aminotransferase family protein [Anaerolineae bacterium]